MGGELRDCFLTFEFKKWIYLHFCLSTWPQQWAVERTSIVRCLDSVMLTADWSWRGNIIYFMNVTKRREWTRVSADADLIQTHKLLVHAIACYITANKLSNLLVVHTPLNMTDTTVNGRGKNMFLKYIHLKFGLICWLLYLRSYSDRHPNKTHCYLW